MKKMMNPGIYPASITPFNQEGVFDEGVLQKLMELNLQEGADGFFLGGSSGECFLLSHEERKEIFKAGAKFKGEVTLTAHVGAVSTQEAIAYARYAKELGYDVIAATPPFYYGFGAASLCKYYYEISAAVDMPVLIYNFPDNTGKQFDLSDEKIQGLFRSDAVLGVKHTNQVVYQMERIRNLNPDLLIFNGYDETMVAGMALGAYGSIGSTFNFMLPHYKAIAKAFREGNLNLALECQQKANNIMECLCGCGLIAGIKYALSITHGLDAGLPRSPFLPLEEEQKQRIVDVLKENLITKE